MKKIPENSVRIKPKFGLLFINQKCIFVQKYYTFVFPKIKLN